MGLRLERYLGLSLFQWGHDPEVMVSLDPIAAENDVQKFQWGHDPEVMVRLIKYGTDEDGNIQCQWGHDPEVMVR